jgi:GNAT superfamily N-acetyltransferase
VLHIDPVLTPAALREFIRLPWRLQGRDPHWVPPLLAEERKLLDTRKNPFYRKAEIACFLARGTDGAPVGRIAAIDNRAHVDFHGERVGFFGFFECADDPAAARALVDAARAWVKGRGLPTIRGPVNPSTNDSCGTLVEGFDAPPFFMMPHNPPFHDALLTGAGLAKAMDLYAWHVDSKTIDVARMERLAKRIAERGAGVRVRPIDLRRFREEVEVVRGVYNRAWARNWGFVPLSKEEFDYVAGEFRKVLVPDFVLIAEAAGAPAGFALALPDLNRAIRHANGRLFPFGWWKVMRAMKAIRAIRVLTLGVVPEHQASGLGMLLYFEIIRRGLAIGYNEAELSWVLESNDLMNRAAEAMGARIHKRYRVYEGSA